MQLAQPYLLWLFIAVPTVLAICWVRLRTVSRRLGCFAEASLLPQLIPSYERVKGDGRRYMFYSSATTLLLVFALARPQWGYTWVPRRLAGADIIIACDLSQSMLAEDVSPNRLIRAQREVMDLINQLRGDRIGLVSFAGLAFTEVPLTHDYAAVRAFLPVLHPDLIPVQGTNIEAVIQTSLAALKRGTSPAGKGRKKKLASSRAIILLTDGEAFDGDVSAAAIIAKKNRTQVHVLGIGTPEGAPIPMSDGYKRDKAGTVVISKLREEPLENLATSTGGMYMRSTVSEADTTAVYQQGITKGNVGSAIEGERIKRWSEYFQVPLLLALLLFLSGPWSNVYSFLAKRHTLHQEGYSALRVWPTVVLLIALGLLGYPPLAYSESAESVGAQARKLYDSGEYAEALKQFSYGAALGKDDFRFALGQGASHYRLREFAQAKALFFEAAARATSSRHKAQALYNAGNSMVQLGELHDAIKAYEDSLQLLPDDKEVRENLEYAKRLLKQQQQQQQEQQKKGGGSSEQQNQGKGQTTQSQEAQKEPKHTEQEKSTAQQNSKDDEASSGDTRNNDNDAQETGQSDKKESPPQGERIPNQGPAGTQIQLDSVHESYASRAKHRNKAGKKELQRGKREIPEKDW